MTIIRYIYNRGYAFPIPNSTTVTYVLIFWDSGIIFEDLRSDKAIRHFFTSLRRINYGPEKFTAVCCLLIFCFSVSLFKLN